MNKTKIEWCDYTWNPVTGCRNRCWYCYAHKIANRFYGNFIPTFHKDRLNDFSPYMKIKKGSKIFVCSMADLFGGWVSKKWIDEVLNIAKVYQGYTFQFLTKNPLRYTQFEFYDNCWSGITNTGEPTAPDYLTQGKLFAEMTIAFSAVKNGFISFEPLLGDSGEIPSMCKWVIIGAMTGQGSPKYCPKQEWVEKLLIQADKHNIPVFMKNNLRPYWQGKLRQEFPLTHPH